MPKKYTGKMKPMVWLGPPMGVVRGGVVIEVSCVSPSFLAIWRAISSEFPVEVK
jgi:hypothetical protein